MVKILPGEMIILDVASYQTIQTKKDKKVLDFLKLFACFITNIFIGIM